MSELILVLGGARSGKSRYAEQLAGSLAGGRPIAYIATMVPIDDETIARIERHRRQRPASWRTIEEPLNAAAALGSRTEGAGAVVLDCVTLLVTNHLMAMQEGEENAFEARVDEEIDALIDAARTAPASVVLVSNEVGLGLVPEYPLARLFRDVAGRANQRLAAAANRVVFMVAGIPMVVKPQ
ncbi:MAG: bifunctional adenosylcobinamide kinase/adenosylcobinamide-phosphate guanylyltransferase [Capsulimonadaceae bacterium]|nr:bifunctional adenosylcobinamide kinase/adenosylcobinamide-phosphate guanylyltransferase [Capsulimonadaceae bacterium]